MPLRPPVLIALLALAAGLPAHAEVRRCALPNGSTVYTDRRCDSIGGQERAAPTETTQLRHHRAACPRTLRDLAYEVSAAVDAHDVNRLAGVYLWSGIGTRAGYALMDRLQAIVDRPLVDLQPIYPGSDEPYPTTVPTRPPIGLRLEQTSIRGGTPLLAVFGLRRHLDCWWIVEGGTRRVTPPPSVEDIPAPAPVPVD
ncbi:MAG TPA: hypothetical protein VFE72_12595 [Lysobacter sp.]|nr:hypothetical protein [Lysobacter sp.]